MKNFVVILTIILFSHTAFPQKLSEWVKRVYNFIPNELTSDQEKLKGQEIDSVWNAVRSDPDNYLPQLRNELLQSDNSFFLVDGSLLLWRLSKSEPDQLIILDCLKRSNIESVSNKNFLKLTHYLTVNGHNTFDLSYKILKDTTFSAFLDNHFISIGQSYSLLFTLLPLKNEYYINQLIEFYKIEPSVYINKTILMVLWYSSTCAGDSLINIASEDMSKPVEVRDYAKRMIRENSNSRRNQEKKYNRLILERNEILKSLSDEALEAVKEIVLKIKENYNCQ